MSVDIGPYSDGTLVHVIVKLIDPVRQTNVRTCVGRYAPHTWHVVDAIPTCLFCATRSWWVRDAH